MEKQARQSLNQHLESSRNARWSWRVLTKVLKLGSGEEKNFPSFWTGGLAEKWCQEHLESLKRSEKKRANFSFYWEWAVNLQRQETLITKMPGREGKQRRVGTSREIIYGCERGGLYLQLNMVS